MLVNSVWLIRYNLDDKNDDNETSSQNSDEDDRKYNNNNSKRQRNVQVSGVKKGNYFLAHVVYLLQI